MELADGLGVFRLAPAPRPQLTRATPATSPPPPAPSPNLPPADSGVRQASSGPGPAKIIEPTGVQTAVPGEPVAGGQPARGAAGGVPQPGLPQPTEGGGGSVEQTNWFFVRNRAEYPGNHPDYPTLRTIGITGIMTQADDPLLASGMAQDRAAGFKAGVWYDPSGAPNAAAAAAHLKAAVGGLQVDGLALDVEFVGKGYQGSPGWDFSDQFAPAIANAFPGVDLMVTPPPLGIGPGGKTDYNYGAYVAAGANVVVQTYGANPMTDLFDPVQVVKVVIANGVPPNRVTALISPVQLPTAPRELAAIGVTSISVYTSDGLTPAVIAAAAPFPPTVGVPAPPTAPAAAPPSAPSPRITPTAPSAPPVATPAPAFDLTQLTDGELLGAIPVAGGSDGGGDVAMLAVESVGSVDTLAFDKVGPGGVHILGGQTFVNELRSAASKYDIDALAAAANAVAEGLGGGIGDSGTAYGPWQIHATDGRLKEFRGLPAYSRSVNVWAWSPAGIDYAFRSMVAAHARGLRGHAAVKVIVEGFERPANIAYQVVNREDIYDSLAKLGPRVWTYLAQAAAGPRGGSGTAQAGGPETRGTPTPATSTRTPPVAKPVSARQAWKALMHHLAVQWPQAAQRTRGASGRLLGAVSSTR